MTMRIRVADVDITPEELARTPELRELIRSLSPSETAAVTIAPAVKNNHPLGKIPQQILTVLNLRSPGGALRGALDAFLAEVLEWEGADPRIGVSRLNKEDFANAIRLHRRGSGVGAFVYVDVASSNLRFRLPRSYSLNGFMHARTRDVQPEVPYGVALRLTPSTLNEATRLARDAYERTLASLQASEQGKQPTSD